MNAVDLEAVNVEVVDLDAVDLEAVDIEGVDMEEVDLDVINLEEVTRVELDLLQIDRELPNQQTIPPLADTLWVIALNANDQEGGAMGVEILFVGYIIIAGMWRTAYNKLC